MSGIIESKLNIFEQEELTRLLKKDAAWVSCKINYIMSPKISWEDKNQAILDLYNKEHKPKNPWTGKDYDEPEDEKKSCWSRLKSIFLSE